MLAPVLDNGSLVTKAASGTNTVTASLTTAQANELVLIVAYVEQNPTAPSITSVSGGGLTWARRKQSNASTQGSIEIWYAFAASAISAQTITVTYGANFDDLSMLMFGVSNVNTSTPFDSNASVPAVYSSSGSGNSPSVSGISTSSANTMLLFASGAVWPGGGAPVGPSGFSNLGYSYNGGGSRFSWLGVVFEQVVAAQSGATFTWGSTVNGNYTEAIFDAIQPAPPPSATYWRLNIAKTKDLTQTMASVAELSLHTSVGGGQAATGGTASASSTNGAQSASNAFDGNASTYWQSSALGAQLVYQFASAVSILEYAITARNDASYGQVPGQWTLEYSNDGTTWTVFDTVADWSWTQGQTKTYLSTYNTGMPKNALGSRTTLKLGDTNGYAAVSYPVNTLAGKAPTPGPKTVSGIVKVNGTATAGLIVCAHAKVTKELLGIATTAGDGSYSIKCGNNFTDVYVVAFDPATYQAVIYDQVVPG